MSDRPVIVRSIRAPLRAETLELILQELRGLRADLATLRAPKNGNDETVTQLVACISRFAGALPFASWQLLDHCTLRDAGDLREAIRACLGEQHATNSKRLGRLLLRIEGRDLGGLRLVRDGDENGTARWRVTGV